MLGIIYKKNINNWFIYILIWPILDGIHHILSLVWNWDPPIHPSEDKDRYQEARNISLGAVFVQCSWLWFTQYIISLPKISFPIVNEMRVHIYIYIYMVLLTWAHNGFSRTKRCRRVFLEARRMAEGVLVVWISNNHILSTI